MITKWCRFKYSYLELLLLTNFQYFEDFEKHSNFYTNLKNLKSFKFLPVKINYNKISSQNDNKVVSILILVTYTVTVNNFQYFEDFEKHSNSYTK